MEDIFMHDISDVKEFIRNLRPLDDYDLIEVKVSSIQESKLHGGSIILSSDDDKKCHVIVSLGYLTHIIFARNNFLSCNICPTEYQLIGILSQIYHCSIDRVIIEPVNELLSLGRVDFSDKDGNKFFINTSASVAIALACTLDIPIFVPRCYLS